MPTRYFTPKQQAVLETRLRENDSEWREILRQIRTERDKGSDLSSPMVRSLARRWLNHMDAFVQGDRGIYEALMQMYQQEGAIAQSWGMDNELFEYILRAIFSMTVADFTGTTIPRQDIFTTATLDVIWLGEIFLREINYFILGTGGLLLGLLAEGKSLAAQILGAAGVSYKTVHPIVVKLLGVRELPKDFATQQLQLAPRVDMVVELALIEAEQAGQPGQIAPEHLLLGILAEDTTSPSPGGVATYILKEELGVDLEILEQRLRAAIRAADRCQAIPA